jgi:hypothetical protein
MSYPNEPQAFTLINWASVRQPALGDGSPLGTPQVRLEDPIVGSSPTPGLCLPFPGHLSTLFADSMRVLDLDPSYDGAYLDRLPASTLATTNLISMFGLHRRLGGALVGHLA